MIRRRWIMCWDAFIVKNDESSDSLTGFTFISFSYYCVTELCVNDWYLSGEEIKLRIHSSFCHRIITSHSLSRFKEIKFFLRIIEWTQVCLEYHFSRFPGKEWGMENKGHDHKSRVHYYSTCLLNPGVTAEAKGLMTNIQKVIFSRRQHKERERDTCWTRSTRLVLK